MQIAYELLYFVCHAMLTCVALDTYLIKVNLCVTTDFPARKRER